MRITGEIALLIVYLLATYDLSSADISDPFALFENYNAKTTKWIQGGPGSKEALQDAMNSVSRLVPWLVAQPEFPPGLDPLAFAANILAFHQTTDHVEIALPLLVSALQLKIPVDEGEVMSLQEACRSNVVHLTRTCQDLYVLLVAHHYHVGKYIESQQYLDEYNYIMRQMLSNRKNDAVITVENSEPTAYCLHTAGTSLQASTPALVHRQLPGLRAKPWWNINGDELTYPFLQGIKSRYTEIRQDVLRAMSHGVWGMNQDLRLSTNPAWDPLTAWEAVPFHANGKWVEESCAVFPLTCEVLKTYEDDLMPLFERDNYIKLAGSDRVKMDYTEIPTLGIKLYKVWPNAGIKNHTGSPGRIVSSIAIIAPTQPASTLTVADTTRPWVEGEFVSFDDSFFHSVDNPNPSVYRVVLAIVTIHPDLLNPQPVGDSFGEQNDTCASPHSQK